MSNYPEKLVYLEEDELVLDTLRDLEQQTSQEIIKQRKHERLAVKAQVILQSGNSSELLKYKVQGVIADISEGGCGAMFPVPIMVGDVFRLSVTLEGKDLPLIFARCRNCRIIREDAYSAGFSFFSPIKLETAQDIKTKGDLL